MLLPNRRTVNLKRLAVEPLGLRIAALCLHHPGEVVEVLGIVRMSLPNRRTVNLKRLAVEPLGLRIAALCPQSDSVIIFCHGKVRKIALLLRGGDQLFSQYKGSRVI